MAEKHADRDVDAIVVGAGPAGLAAGLALAAGGLTVALIGPEAPADPAREGRTAALFPQAVDVLRAIGVWDGLLPACEPVRAIRIVDAMGRLLRAPEVRFDAADAGLDVLAYNVPNAPLVGALENATRGRALTRIATTAAAVEPGPDHVAVRLADGGCVRAPLLVAADGRKSLSRDAAGIAVRTWRYPQTAIATSFTHTRPHGGISTEFHRPAGPFTVVPMPGLQSSLVWLDRPEDVERLTALDDRGFAAEIAERLGGLLGGIGDVRPRLTHPMGGLIATRRAARRIVLIGETAHAFPPIGAQGLNLSLRDVAALVDVAGAARDAGRDIGGADVLDGYERARAGDVTQRVVGVDLLNRSLIAGPLAGLARGIGLHALHASPRLKQLAMRHGFGAASASPRPQRP